MYIGATFNFNNFYNKNASGEVNFRVDYAEWQVWLVFVLSVILIVLDRFEFFRWRDEVPLRWAAAIFTLKVILIQTITMIKPNEVTVFMYIVIPITAMMYFGEKVGILTGFLVWAAFISRVLFFSPQSFRLYQPSLYANVFTVTLFLP